MALLTDPLTLRSLTIPNRVWLSPMCTYSTDAQGIPTDFHLAHYGARALGGFGLIMTEATAITPNGRITGRDVGLWSDEQVPAWARIVDFCHTYGAVMAVQLAHAGRKADGVGEAFGPSPVAFPGYPVPHEMSHTDIDEVVGLFIDAAQRAEDAGFDVIEIHAAHGYLLHQFLSPLSNQRTDEYGGSRENRMRLLVRVVDALRSVWDGPLLVRISATDWIDGGWGQDDSVALAKVLADHGVDLMDISTGGNAMVDIALSAGYQLPFAQAIGETGMPVAGVGLLTTADDVAQALTRVDAAFVGRVGLREPSFPQRIAHELGLDIAFPQPYVRGAWPN